MKKLSAILLMSFMVTFAFGVTNFTVNGIKYTTTGTNTVQVTQGGTYTGAIIIPTSVTYSAVSYNVTSIGSQAFMGCTALTSITIPSSVTSIGSSAFSSCYGLITVESGNLNYSSQDGILYNKTKTLLIQCPTSKSGSFIMPSLVTSIGFSAFGNCTGLTSITIPSSVTSIENYAFSYCIGLTSFTIPSSVTSIGSSAFEYCSGLTSITIPSSVTSIGSSAFQYCSGLTSVTISSSVTSIESFTFYYCTGLTSVTIPSSVISIGDYAFQYCSGLTSVIIPSSVTTIRNKAFYSCSALTSIIAYSTDPIHFELIPATDVFLNVNKTICILYVPSISLSSYQSAYQWDNFTNIKSIPLFVTASLSQFQIYDTKASGGGNITSDGGFAVTARGVCWSITASPTIANSKTADGTGTGSFSSNITGLNPATTYHIRAYATNSAGTVYGDDLTFTTLASIPTINTTVPSLITGTTATTGGNITSANGLTVTSRGVCWSTTSNPTVTNSKTADGTGTGTFISIITGLISSTTYHIRAYATNSVGTAYGSDLTFKTLANTEVFETNIEDIDFYPNPTNGIININIGSGNFTDCLVNITNSLGQKVYNSKLYTEKTTLDLTKISKSGLLFIQIINNKGAVIGEKKILVK